MAVSISPTSGRIVMRPLPDGSGALLGVLGFPAQFRVLESAGYLFCPSRRGARIYDPPYDAGPPADIDGWGINASLRSPQWPVFLAHPELMLVRFIAAFPKQNVWAVYLRRCPSTAHNRFELSGRARLVRCRERRSVRRDCRSRTK